MVVAEAGSMEAEGVAGFTAEASAEAEDIPATARHEAIAAVPGTTEPACRAAVPTAADSEAAPLRTVFVPARHQAVE
jgi:hypothetical protein